MLELSVAFVRFYSYQADFSCAERLDINLKQILMAIFCIMHIKAVKRRQNPVGICGEPCICTGRGKEWDECLGEKNKGYECVKIRQN